MATEEDLLKLVFGDAQLTNFTETCIIKMNELRNEPIKLYIVKIIGMCYSSGKLEFGEYLSAEKSSLLNHLYQTYANPTKYDDFLLYLSQMKKYGVILVFLREVEEMKNNIFFDFFKILMKKNYIRDIAAKYFYKKLKKYLPYNTNINDVEQLIGYINNSHSLSENNCDYNILYSYIIAEKCNLKNNNELENLQKSEEFTKIKENFEIAKTNNLIINNNSNIIIDNKPVNKYLNEINDADKDNFKSQENFNIFIDYYKSRKEYYSKKGYETPFLDRLIKEELVIYKDIFCLLKPIDEYLFEPHYSNLDNVVEAFSDTKKFEKLVINEKKYGYICYEVKKDGKSYFLEGIYGILDNCVLYNEISNKRKFVKEAFGKTDTKISNNAFKARGLALEYYVNGLFMDLLEQDELPRAIYNFDPEVLEKLELEEKEENEELEDDAEEEEKINIKTNQDKIAQKEIVRERQIEELDAIFYAKKDYNINVTELPFIIDDVAEIDNLQSPKFNIYAQNNNCFEINKNTLILIEVKNKFPEPLDFPSQVGKTCNKVFSFIQLFEERFPQIEKIKIMFFYDAVPKKLYDDNLLEILENIFETSKIKDKIQFQFIFITSSYLAYNFKYLKDKILTMEKNFSTFKKDINGKVEFLEKKIEKLFGLIESKENNYLNKEKINDMVEKNIALEKENKILKIENEELKKVIEGNVKINIEKKKTKY